MTCLSEWETGPQVLRCDVQGIELIALEDRLQMNIRLQFTRNVRCGTVSLALVAA